MTYIRRELRTNDKEMQRYLDQLMKNLVVELPPRLAMDLGRHKTIRNIRNINRSDPAIIIGLDRRVGKSIVMLKKPILSKNGNRYIFEL